jgi:phospholipid/cholesterol/gamma-HCH transport system permease protein
VRGQNYEAGTFPGRTKNAVTASEQNDLVTDVLVRTEGRARVILRGRLDAQTVPACWNKLERDFLVAKIETLEVDASGLRFCDGAGFALLRYLNTGRMTPLATVSVLGLEPSLDNIFRGFTSEDYEAFRPQSRMKCRSLPDEVGNWVRHVASDLREQMEFCGSVIANLPAALLNRKRMRWAEVRRVFELAGANAVPIISLISVLVGLIIAFEAIQPLAQFGAQIYVVNMIGLLMVRELGPLLAAIILAGRSGSAFAAEIGTMKVNEELNALETLGLDPIRFLVVQRITAGILLTPLLTFYATFMGVVGGVLVTLGLGFPLTLIFHQLTTSVHLSDVILGAAKGVVFGAIVSGVGCLRGLQTQQGPSSVGISTTRAVVTSILLIVIADAVFSILFFFLKQ